MKYIDHEESNLEKNLQDRINECKVSYRLPKYLSGIAVDIGANIGGFACMAHSNFAKIICIEANKDSVECLRKNLIKKNISNVEIYNLAVSDTKGKYIKLYKLDQGKDTNSGNCGTLWNRSKDLSSLICEEEQVLTTDLEEILSFCKCSHCGNSEIDYMKIDCEGSEYSFLMNKDLSMVKIIIGEYHPGCIDHKIENLWDHISKTHDLKILPNNLFIARSHSYLAKRNKVVIS